MEILKKFKDVLKEEDLKELELAIEKMIAEQVAIKVEEQSKKAISEGLEIEKKKINEEYDAKLLKLESTIVEKLDQFLDSEISENISEESLEKIAINETYKPIIEGVKKLFEEHFVQLDSEGHKILREAKEEIEKLEAKINEEIESKMTLKTENENLKKKNLLSEKCEGLTKEQKERVVLFFEGKDYAEISEKVNSMVELVIKESVEADTKVKKDEKENDDVLAESDDVGEEKIVRVDKTVEKAGNLL